MSNCRSIAVRLEGGLGDHILGMRILSFIHQRYPRSAIVAYSDSGGNSTQLQVAAMAPHVSKVVAIYQRASPRRDNVGALANVRAEDLKRMLTHDLFIDTYGAGLFARAATTLNVPIFEILASRPRLRVSSADVDKASRLLAAYAHSRFVAINLAKYGTVERHATQIEYLLRHVLECRDVIVLNLFRTSYTFDHWPTRERLVREQNARDEWRKVSELCRLSKRIVPCVDLSIGTVAALLARCKYFIGIDNGIKHLAWALGLPHTFFYLEPPTTYFTLRWLPDLHRMLLVDCSREDLQRHAQEAIAGIDSTRNCEQSSTMHQSDERICEECVE